MEGVLNNNLIVCEEDNKALICLCICELGSAGPASDLASSISDEPQPYPLLKMIDVTEMERTVLQQP